MLRIGVNFPWENLKTYVQGVLYRLSRLDLEIHMHIYSHMFTMNEIKKFMNKETTNLKEVKEGMQEAFEGMRKFKTY